MAKRLLPLLSPTQGNLPNLNFNDEGSQRFPAWFWKKPWHEIESCALRVQLVVDPNIYRSEHIREIVLLPTDKRPTDNNVYCIDPCTGLYAVVSKISWGRLRGRGSPPSRIGQLNAFLNTHRQLGHFHIERGAMTPGLIDVLGESWGKYMRSGEADPTIPCALGGALDQMKTLGFIGHGFKRNNHYYAVVDRSKVPIKGMTRTQLLFHRAWCGVGEVYQCALWVNYVPVARPSEKHKVMGLTADGYRFLVDDAKSEIIAQIDPHRLGRSIGMQSA